MLIEIKSNDNGRVKLVRKLHTKKGRSEEGKFVAEGINLVRELFERGLKADFVMSSKSVFEDEASEAHAILRELAASDDSVICVLDDRDFEKISDAEHGIDVLAVVAMPGRDANPAELIGKGSNVLVLDRIQDPGNLGTLVRTAAAAGYAAVLALKGTADIYSPKVLRATAGTVFDIPFVYVDSEEDLMTILRACDKKLAVSDVRSGTAYYDADMKRDIALVIGNEGSGVTDTLLDMADIRVTLPMKGGVESLNAAVAGALLMYESVRS